MTKKIYTLVHWSVPTAQHELAAAALVPFPFLGIDHSPDTLVISFENAVFDSIWPEAIEEHWTAMGIQFSGGRVEEIEEENWNARWEESIDVVRISDRVTIAPPWKLEEVRAEITLIIKPQMSFGTGHHETTRLIAAMLEHHVRPGTNWIDAGTGTGILAILALKLGARYALGIDFDEWSTENAAENITANDLDGRIDIRKADLTTTPLPASDGIVANVNTFILKKCFKQFAAALRDSGGPLLLSGILIEEADGLIEEATRHGFVLKDRTSESEWTAMYFQLS